jgi:hypothetical protein
MPHAPAAPIVSQTGGTKEEGVLRRSLYGSAVVFACVVLAFVAVVLTLVLNR